MTDPLRIDRARAPGGDEDMGDVLASIRRLIAQDDGPSGTAAAPAADGTGFPRPAAGMAAPAPAFRDAAGGGAEQPGPLRLERTTGAESAGLVAFPSFGTAPARPAFLPSGTPVTPAAALQTPAAPAGVLPLSPAGTAELTASLAEAVGAAAARMAETARPAAPEEHAMPDDSAEPPFRLRPDALIPAAPPAMHAGPAQALSPRPLTAQPLSPVWGDAGVEAAGDNPAEPAPPPSLASAGGTSAGAAAQSAAPAAAPPAPSGWTMHWGARHPIRPAQRLAAARPLPGPLSCLLARQSVPVTATPKRPRT
ncbi:hypothetical protein [Paracoccus contaminans]|uniref:Uncharacterized protein n=1 Tax=Paracoccus contaminans TaxID=1945662 RepID=A0A1W6CVG9_9RHOB|nr:hypothetical protein [Paracoccus contaminans]ARJ68857.1 hypothetical protein B0A89_03630 [Paracoccus contaminans]